MFAFPKTSRLLNKSDFQETFEGGRKTVGKHFVVVASVSEKKARLGLVVSKKVGKAVQRNRVKRVIREFFRLNQEKVPSANFVVIARHNAAERANDLLVGDLHSIFRRACRLITREA